MENLRTRLKKSEPYLIDKELLPKLYLFDNDGKKTEYLIFKYIFIIGLKDEAVGVRTDTYYDRHQIYRITMKILNRNKTLIEEFLQAHNK